MSALMSASAISRVLSESSREGVLNTWRRANSIPVLANTTDAPVVYSNLARAGMIETKMAGTAFRPSLEGLSWLNTMAN
jgi:hypothetical protein